MKLVHYLAYAQNKERIEWYLCLQTLLHNPYFMIHASFDRINHLYFEFDKDYY